MSTRSRSRSRSSRSPRRSSSRKKTPTSKKESPSPKAKKRTRRKSSQKKAPSTPKTRGRTPIRKAKDVSGDADMVELELKNFATRLAKERKNLVVWKRPVTTISNFVAVSFGYLQELALYTLSHPVMLYVGFPLIVLWFVITNIEGPHRWYTDEAFAEAEFVVWWAGLGVLSSIGFGSGMHSGMLFLFPYIIETSITSNRCESLDFNTRNHMWWRTDETMFECLSPSTGPVNFWGIFAKVFWACFLWGGGTAIGEIPPYAISRAAKLAGIQNEEFAEIKSLEEETGPVAAMKKWMIDFIKKWGFWGVLAFSAWPNMAFDLCGICCGHFLMPFWEFFSATFIGKACIKAPLQGIALIVISSNTTFQYLQEFLKYTTSFTPAALHLDSFLDTLLTKARDKLGINKRDHAIKDPEETLIQWAWGLIVFAAIGYFVLSCVHDFAQQYQAKLDRKEVHNIRECKSKKTK